MLMHLPAHPLEDDVTFLVRIKMRRLGGKCLARFFDDHWRIKIAGCHHSRARK